MGSIVFLYNENNKIGITKLEMNFKTLPADFDGYTILHISDLHNKEFGKNQKRLVSQIIAVDPDLIVITGDIIDSRDYNEEISLSLLTQIQSIAPIYFVTGNHEARSHQFDSLAEQLKETTKVLRNESNHLKLNNSEILIIGVDDPAFGNEAIDQVLNRMTDEINNNFTILLSHRPELLNTYAKGAIDLVFSGHAHGGQIRLPIFGGLVAPNQGLLPKYTNGVYTEGNTRMVISRGLGNSIFKQRIFNRPELVVVTLIKEE
jgi:hypothetical protein